MYKYYFWQDNMHLDQVLVIEESSYGYSESFHKMYHVIYLMQKQIYFLRNLHVHSHYTIKLSILKQLEMNASNENAPISRYLINQLSRHKLNTSWSIGDIRNTTQISYGICSHSYKQYIMSNGLPKSNILSRSIDAAIKTAMRNISNNISPDNILEGVTKVLVI